MEPNEISIVQAPTGPAVLTQHDQTLYSVMVDTANRNPRNIANIVTYVSDYVTSSDSIALACLYVKPTKAKVSHNDFAKKQLINSDKQTISAASAAIGESVFFAKILKSFYPNLLVESYVVSEDDKQIIAGARAWDMQINAIETRQHTESLLDSEGKKIQTARVDLMRNSAMSKAFRKVVLSVIPEAIWGPIIERCKTVCYQEVIADKFKPMLDFFEAKGVGSGDLFDYLEINPNEISPSQWLGIRLLAEQLKRGETKADEIKARPKVVIKPNMNN